MKLVISSLNTFYIRCLRNNLWACVSSIERDVIL